MRVASVDTDVEELIDEGVHVCIAAGNNSFKVDVTVVMITIIILIEETRCILLQRKSSSTEAFMVGSLLSENATGDRKVNFSTQVLE